MNVTCGALVFILPKYEEASLYRSQPVRYILRHKKQSCTLVLGARSAVVGLVRGSEIMIVWNSIGGVKLKSIWSLPRFLRMALKAKKQALASEGCLRVELFRNGRIFYVLSVWKSPAHMSAYGRSASHVEFLKLKDEMFEFAHNAVFMSSIHPNRTQAVAQWDRDHA